MSGASDQQPQASSSNTQVDSLSSAERNTLLAVMETKDQLEQGIREPITGSLLKWTNVVKGWQLRHFLLSPDTGMLHYYLSGDRLSEGVPRGTLHLHGAFIQPSDSDQCMFAIFPTVGDPYRLRAANVKDRQLWVDRLRHVVHKHTSDFNCLVAAVKTLQPPSTASPPAVERQNSDNKAGTMPSEVAAVVGGKGGMEPVEVVALDGSGNNFLERSVSSDSQQQNSLHQELLNMHVLLHSLNISHKYHNEILQYCNASPHFADPKVLSYRSIAASLFKLLDETYDILNKLKVEDNKEL